MGLPRTQRTSMVPCIAGWMWQVYVYCEPINLGLVRHTVLIEARARF